MANTCSNNNLTKAKAGKNDEFYTDIIDIEKELKHYKTYFKNKVVFCNCDDPRLSKFFRYFLHNFEKLGLKKLITCYKKPAETGISEPTNDGDFRSAESIELLKQSDIVVTNPPFSLFSEYVAQLIEHDKKFLIIGSLHNLAYKEIFKLVKENKIWLGVNNTGIKWFKVPDHYEMTTKSRMKTVNGQSYFGMSNIVWFTNLGDRKQREDIPLHKTYHNNESDYPTYDNYDAINVDRVANIPMDYKGLMGVPMTFIDKHNPEQFEIIGIDRVLVEEVTGKVSCFFINNKEKYTRIVIRNKRI